MPSQCVFLKKTHRKQDKLKRKRSENVRKKKKKEEEKKQKGECLRLQKGLRSKV